jgi:hypothetical protein
VSQDGLAALRAYVAADEACAQALSTLPTEAFAEAVLRLAAERGCEVTAADLNAAMVEAQRAWQMRWMS